MKLPCVKQVFFKILWRNTLVFFVWQYITAERAMRTDNNIKSAIAKHNPDRQSNPALKITLMGVIGAPVRQKASQ